MKTPAAARRRASLFAGLGLAIAAWSMPAAAQELGVIPTRIIYPGETIVIDALQMARVRKGRTTTVVFAHQMDELVGKIAKRTLLPGRFVPLASVRNALRGDLVCMATKPSKGEQSEDVDDAAREVLAALDNHAR